MKILKPILSLEALANYYYLMQKKYSFLLFYGMLFFICVNVSAQENDVVRCGTNAYMETLLQNKTYREAYEKRQAIVASKDNNEKALCDTPLKLPIAIHFQGVTATAANKTCLEALSLSQVEVLNQDYQGTNSDISEWINTASASFPGVNYSETCFEFIIATSDHPIGYGLSEGDYAITYNVFTGDNNSDWAGYINVFVQENLGTEVGFSPLGGMGNGDGIAVEHGAFGVLGFNCLDAGPDTESVSWVFDQGRTLTHEMGHYLNLEHIWGGSPGCNTTDGVDDTPASEDANYNCPNIGIASCGSTDMHMNYMDYVDDVCMYMFTEGQGARMENYVDNYLGEQLKLDLFTEVLGKNLTFSQVALYYTEGSMAHIRAFITNNGTEDILESSTVKFYLSLDEEVSTADYEIASALVPPLAVGDIHTENILVDAALVLPSIPSGEYYVGSIIDYNDEVFESNEMDNTFIGGNSASGTTTVITAPNLTFSQVALYYTEGSMAHIRAFITNDGTEDIAESSAVKFYLSLDEEVSTADYEIASALVPPLAVGDIHTENILVDAALVLPSIPSGEYYVGSIIDYNDEVFESNEMDNTFIGGNITSGTTTVIARPNLTTSSKFLSVDNTLLEMEINVINDGIGEINVPSEIGFFLSTDNVITTADYPIGNLTVPTLETMEIHLANFAVNVTTSSPSVPAGEYFIGFILDVEDAVIEDDETDNTFYWMTEKVRIEEVGCGIPTQLNRTSGINGNNTIRLSWDEVPNATGYKIAGKKASAANNAWATWNTNTPYKDFSGIVEGVTYKWTVRVLCNGSEWASVETFTYSNASPQKSVSLLPDPFDVQNNNTLSMFCVYPNPAKSQISLEYTQNKETQKVNIAIFDILGKAVITEEQNAILGINRLQLDIENLQKGIYFIQIDNGIESIMEKITVL